ncbi:MAG: hypothetical protein AAF990_06475 [Bacteroidota bacterium]
MKLRLLTLFLLLFSGFLALPGRASNKLPLRKAPKAPDLTMKKHIPFVEDSLAALEESLLRVPVHKKADGFFFPEIDEQFISSMSEEAAAPNNNPVVDKMGDILETVGNGSYSAKVRKAKQVIEKAIDIGNFLTTLTGENLEKATLPIIIPKTIGNVTAYLVINEIVLKPQWAELEVYVGMRIPSKNSSIRTELDIKGIPGDGLILMFAASGVKFSSEAGIIGDATIGLLSKVSFEVGGKNKKTAITLLPWNTHEAPPDTVQNPENFGTFVTIDCDGVKQFGIEASFCFSREWILPTDEFGHELPELDANGKTNRVKAHLALKVEDWNNMLFENIKLTHFVLTSFRDMSFYVGNANVDLSDFSNPQSLTFPTGYEHGLPEDNLELWRGAYIETLEITLPDPFKKKCITFGNGPQDQDTSMCRIKISGNNMLIDETGVTGGFSIEGEAPLLSGGLMNKKWAWSLDSVGIQILQSELNGFGFRGELGVPIMKKTTPLEYRAHVNFNPTNGTDYEYKFNVILGEEKSFPLWKAGRVTLKGGTEIIVSGQVEDNKVVEFLPVARLNGCLTIGKPGQLSSGENGSKIAIPEVQFQKLVLRTQAPYLSLDPNGGYIGVSGTGENNLFNFPISVDDLGITITNGGTKAELGMTIGLQLVNSGDGGLSADGTFRVVGKLVTEGSGAQYWVYDKFEFDGAHVSLILPKFKIEGTINIFEGHEKYGDGFSGKLCASILSNDQDSPACSDNSSSLRIDVSAIFGRTANFRYWLVDGFVTGDAVRITLLPSPLVINGFGGGAFYHMKPSGYEPSLGGEPAQPGVDASGIVYDPDPSTKLGLKFAVGFTTTGNTLKGTATCIIRFGEQMSLQNITFWGVADFIQGVPGGEDRTYPDVDNEVARVALPPAMMQSSIAAEVLAAYDVIKAKVGMSLDFDHGILHGYADVFINLPDAGFVGYGVLDLLVDPGDGWHLFVGGYRDGSVKVPTFWDPTTEISLYPALVAFNLWGFNMMADVYFMTGTGIPGPPPLHPEAAEYFGETPTTNRAALDNVCPQSKAALGTGLAFGTSVSFKFKKKKKKRIFGVKITLYKFDIKAMFGADFAFLKYSSDSQCQDGQPSSGSHGWNGFRVRGTIWVFVNAKGKVMGIPLPEIGLGLKMTTDFKDPSYFDAIVVINFIKKWRIGLDLGTECGVPCD